MAHKLLNTGCAGLILMYLCLLAAPVTAGVEDGPRHAAHPDWMTPALVDLESDLEKVQAEGKRGIMLLFTTAGCTYCAEFIRASLGDPATVKRVRQHFVAIGLEIFDDVEMTDTRGNDLPIKVFAEQYKAGMAPTLLFLGPDGQLEYRAIGYQSPQRFNQILDYLTGNQQRKVSFREYLSARLSGTEKSPTASRPMRDDPLFMKPPYALSRRDYAATEPMLVIFEAPACDACEAFHKDVLALTEVRQLLHRFEVVRLNAEDDTTPVQAPDGRRTTPAQWFAQAGFSRLPALLYYDEAGRQVFETDALVERQRMLNATGRVLERAYEKGWSYQRFARSKAIERNNKAR